MSKVVTNLIIPFLTGFCLGMVLCFGLYLMDVGGLRGLLASSHAGVDLTIELIRFAGAFGVMSVATHFGVGLVVD